MTTRNVREIVEKRRQIKTDTKWRLNLKEALRKRGIDHAFALWQKIGGSKQTASDLFNGKVTMVRLETFDRLDETLGITPFELFEKVEHDGNSEQK